MKEINEAKQGRTRTKQKDETTDRAKTWSRSQSKQKRRKTANPEKHRGVVKNKIKGEIKG